MAHYFIVVHQEWLCMLYKNKSSELEHIDNFWNDSIGSLPHEVTSIVQYLLFSENLHHCICKPKCRGVFHCCSSHSYCPWQAEIIDNNNASLLGDITSLRIHLWVVCSMQVAIWKTIWVDENFTISLSLGTPENQAMLHIMVNCPSQIGECWKYINSFLQYK